MRSSGNERTLAPVKPGPVELSRCPMRILLSTALAVAILPASASAGTIVERDRSGDVRASGLSAKERKALDIVSVTARGDSAVGLFVTVTFRGDFERAIGRRHLKGGLAALVLRPKSKAQKPAGILTKGPGIVGTTLRRSRSKDVGVIRNGRRLTFFITGGGLADVKSVEVKVFAKRPRRSARARGATTKLESAVEWLRITKQKAADAEELAATDLKTASCQQLKDLRASAEAQRVLLKLDEKELTKLRDDIDRALGNVQNRDLVLKIGNAVRSLLGAEVTFETVQRDLGIARRLTARALARNKEARENLIRFEGKIDGLLAAKEACKPGQQVDTVVGPPQIGPP